MQQRDLQTRSTSGVVLMTLDPHGGRVQPAYAQMSSNPTDTRLSASAGHSRPQASL